MLESIEELQRLKDLRRAVLQVNSLDEFKTILASNGSLSLRRRNTYLCLSGTLSIFYKQM